MGQYANELYSRNLSLECENKALRGVVEEFKNGKRYQRIAEGYEKVIAGYRRENQRLKKALAAEEKTTANAAMKGLTNSVVLALEDLAANNGKWSADYAGKTAVLGAADDCVGLPTAEGSWRLNTFTVAEYEALFELVKNGTVAISNATDVEPTVTITVDYNA